MKLYGSLENRIQENQRPIQPATGMGATIVLYSDRVACTIFQVEKNRIEVKRDKATRVDNNGMCDVGQVYQYETQPNCKSEFFTLRKHGFWVKEGDNLHTGSRIIIGIRDEKYDFCF